MSEPMLQVSGHPVPSQDLLKTRERIVLLMMTLVAAAAAAIFRFHLGYSAVAAAAAGCAVLAGFLALHTLKKRAAQIGRLRHDLSRLEQELVRLRPQGTAGTKIGNSTNAGAAFVESESEKAKSTSVSNSSSAAQVSPAGQKRTPPLNPVASPPPAFGSGSLAPRDVGPSVLAPSISDGAPERISPDARWEAPGFGRAGKSATATKTDAIAQSLAPTLNTSMADRTAAPVASAGPLRSGARPQASELFEAPSWSGTSISSTDPLRDAWSFRPKEAVESRPFAPDAGAAVEPAHRMPAPLGDLTNTSRQPLGIEADLEMVQRKIKAMAEEVNAAEAYRLRPPSDSLRAVTPATPAAVGGIAGAGYAPVSAGFGTAAMAIEDGISALKNAAGAMRSPAAALPAPRESIQAPASAMLPPADLLIPSTARPIAVSASPAAALPPIESRQPGLTSAVPPPDEVPVPRPSETRAPENRISEAREPKTKVTEVRDSRVAEIAKAIETKSMDVLLSPIVGLGDYAVTHFEVSVRLRGADGPLPEHSEEALTLAGSHLLALFDAERLSRTAAVAELLESRGKNGAVMTAATGTSMSDAHFLETFARVYETRNSISGQLVLTFSQADVEAFGSGTWQALSDMHSFGFRFALDRVTHLGMDFEHLAQCGFTFVKLLAHVYMNGLPSDSGFITVNDICRHLARCGLTLVVESVDDEALLARVFGFGALFGQGQLFGAPRQISLDTLAPAQSAAA